MTVPLQMLAIILLFGNIFFISKGILQGLQRFREMFYGDLAGNAMKIISVLILLYLGFQSVVLLVWVIWFAISSALFLYHMRDIKPDAQRFDKQRLFGYSFWSVCYLLSSMVLLQGGIILLSSMASLEAAAFFGTAFVFGQFLLFIPTVLMGSMLPVMSEQWSADMARVKGLLAVSIKSIFLWVFPIYVVFVLMSEFLIELLYSTKYIGAASLFPAYLTGMLLFGISMMLMITLYSAGHPKRRAATMVAGALMSIILSIIMIPFYGAEGAAMAFLLSQIVIFLASMFFVHKKFHIYFNNRNLLWLPAILLFSVIIYSASFFDNMYVKLACVAFAGIMYLAISLKLGIVGDSDKLLVRQLLEKLNLRFRRIRGL
jgi:O-antigen/teichoic acid export membrane protein